jgi:large subunit ribosomal protein L10
LNRDQKAAVIEEVAAQISESEAVFAVDYRGISVPQAAQLRTSLRDADASFRVIKNTLSERAADKAGADPLKQLLDGPTAMTFVRGDAAAAAKALRDFRRANQLLEFKGGWMNGAALSADEVDAIAQLPSREVLYGRLVGMVASPLTGLAGALNGLIGGLARQLAQISEQGLVGGGAPAAEAPGEEPPSEAAPEEAAGDTDAGPTTSSEEPGPDPDPTPSDTETQED